MTHWLGPHVVPIDAYRRLMRSRDWSKVQALKIFSAGVVVGELLAALLLYLGGGR